VDGPSSFSQDGKVDMARLPTHSAVALLVHSWQEGMVEQVAHTGLALVWTGDPFGMTGWYMTCPSLY
jgi:hypothetical protein